MEIYKAEKLAAIIFHGGYHTLLEVVEETIPMVIIPGSGLDQPMNCQIVEN